LLFDNAEVRTLATTPQPTIAPRNESKYKIAGLFPSLWLFYRSTLC